ncbi:MAG TPA: YcnI family protein [Micromonosporaceae bacterium]|nr:YcnI family protein [Micromonosporaceae bacterium]
MIRPWRSAAAALAVTLGAAVVGVFGFAAPASAHVTVNPREATQGGYARVAFRVPTESDTARTTKVEVVFPEDAPVASVSTMPVPGWTVAVERRKVDPPLEVHGSPVTEVISKITWTAGGDTGIGPGEFQEFPVSLGPLPKTDRMVFKALQTYSDGNVVRWIEEPPADGGEVDHPAPVLTLAAAAAPAAEPAPAAAEKTAAGTGGTPGWHATGIVAALVAGIAGLVLGALAFARGRRTS